MHPLFLLRPPEYMLQMLAYVYCDNMYHLVQKFGCEDYETWGTCAVYFEQAQLVQVKYARPGCIISHRSW